MNDPGLNNLLKWGIQNSEASRTAVATEDQPPPKLDAEALQRLMSGMAGPSDADLMKQSMHVIQNEEAELEHRVTAFDNLEQLIENLDNANNLEALGLWMPLVEQLANNEPELRRYAAWCCGTAVQNNIKTQERVSFLGPAPPPTDKVSLTHSSCSLLAPFLNSCNWPRRTRRNWCAKRPSPPCRRRSATSRLPSTRPCRTCQLPTSRKPSSTQMIWGRWTY